MTASAPALAETQAWLLRALRFPEHVDARETVCQLVPCGALSASDHLAIYQRSYRLRLEACLREQFPVLCQALGSALFDDFARAYVRACPPESYTLHDLGRRLPDYLERERPDRAAEAGHEHWVNFMIDLARFERQLFVLFDARGHEDEPLALSSMPDASLELGRGVALGEYRFPVASYHHDVRHGREP
ncbi:MAG TPA: DNA-binding domain-containing protein, partial [Polyangiaceae bacterium]|nr:DNA-binding domain-containing protein [Polyangiaceae bacterium]